MSAGLGGLGVASGVLAAYLTRLQPVVVPVSGRFLLLTYYQASRRGAGRRRPWVWLAITTPVPILSWLWPWLAR